MIRNFVLLIFASLILGSCNNNPKNNTVATKDTLSDIGKRIAQYPIVKLEADLSGLSENDKLMIPLLLKACDIMDDLYWEQSYGSKQVFLKSITDEQERKFAEMNYGPWERLKGNEVFLKGFHRKPDGCNYYPSDITKDEFQKFTDPQKNSPYTLIRRDSTGKLFCVPYHQAFKDQLIQASELLKKAATYSSDPQFASYLKLRAEALLSDEYKTSDLAWMDIKNNSVDLIIGPIEQYEDGFAGIKTAYQGLVLIKDKTWSKELGNYFPLLPDLQKELPIGDNYKKVLPKSTSELSVYDLIYCKGYANSEGKTIAISLPNDEDIIMKKGLKNFNLKNVMKLKFESILKPISDQLIDPAQRKYINFDAFFKYTMFQKMSHLMGIKDFIQGRNLHETMKEKYNVLEETKAHLLALYMANKLYEKKAIKEGSIEEIYTTFMAGLLRNVRFGVSNFQGKTYMLIFNTFAENGAFKRNPTDGTYSVNFQRMTQTIDVVLTQILVMQGNQDYDGVTKLLNQKGIVKMELQKDLDKLKEANIPLDIVFDQGVGVLKLK